MYQDMIKSIKWSSERIIYTDQGKRLLKEAVPPSNFWNVWKIYKEKIKEQGISVSKFSGQWKLQRWEDISKETREKEDIHLSSDILYDYQKEHAEILISDLKHGNALDASDTGTGKTYVAIAIAKHLGLMPIVITPKPVITSWRKVAATMDVNIFVSNYEQFRLGKTPYLQAELKSDSLTEKEFIWNNTELNNCIIIFDEVHRTKNQTTQNAQMLVAAKKTNNKILCLSATIADNPLQLYALGITLDLFRDKKGFWNWAYKRGVYKNFFGHEFRNTPENLNKIHADIFPHKGHRIAIKDLGDKFPDNLVITDSYEMNSAGKKIQEVYDSMRKELDKLSETKKKDGSSVLTEILRARQEVELLKVPTFAELAEDAVEEGNSIAIFVNFEQTVEALQDRLKCNCILTGKIRSDERDMNIQNFQEDKDRIIICNIKAGGIGVSLHDLNGNYPRMSLISPTFSAQDLKQTLGRIHRAGGKSKSIQKIIFAAGTIEESVAEKVAKKIKNIEAINEGDLNNDILNTL